MRPASARHLVVLGVCALGVVGLYVAPSLARSSGSVPPGDRERGEPASMSAHSAPGEGTVHGRLNAPMATAHDPALLPDTTPPSSVQGISFPEILPDRLTIRWAPASDDVGIAAYRIWLDGFQLADTTAL